MEAALLLSDMLLEQKRLPEVQERLAELVKFYPDMAEVQLALGLVLKEQEKYEEALSHLREAVLCDSDDPDVYNALGECCVKIQAYDQAESFYAQALRLRPDFDLAMANLGELYYDRSDFHSALLVFEQLKILSPDDPEIAALIKECLSKKGAEILIVQEEGIGNMVMLTPAIRAIKENLPNCNVTVLGKYPSLEVIEGWELVDKTITEFDDRVYDYVFFTIWSLNTKRQFGDAITSKCRNIVEINYNDPSTHEVGYHLEISRHLGYHTENPSTYCAIEDVELELPDDATVVGICDTTRLGPWERKRWPYYKDLARMLVDDGYAVVLIGGPQEAERFKKEEWPEEVINCLGKYRVAQTAGILNKCDIVIANDSGPAHIAAALGTKTYTLFGPTRVTKNQPIGPQVQVLTKNLPCSPCQYTTGWDECSDWQCMSQISPQEVMQAIKDGRSAFPSEVFDSSAAVDTPFEEAAPEHMSVADPEPVESRQQTVNSRQGTSSPPSGGLSLISKDYSDCRVVREDNITYVERDGFREQLKVHLVGARWANFPWGMENEVFRSFEKMGCEVFDTDYRLQADNLDELFLREAHLTLVFKGSGIQPELIEELKCPSILWYQDDIFTTGHGRRDIAYSGSAYDRVYTFDKSAIEEYKNYGIKDVRWLPLCMSPAVHKKMYIPKVHDVSFVGNIYPNRERLISRLRERFDVFVTKAYMDEMVKVFNESKIVLNLGIGNTGIQSRVFEALGCGSFLLTNEIQQDARLFKDRKHLVYFNESDIEEAVAYYLENEEEREQIALHGYLEANRAHTYDHRVEAVLKDLFPLIPDRSSRGQDSQEDRDKKSSIPIISPSEEELTPKRRLLVFWHGIGDNIMATPSLRALKEKYPDDSLGFMYLKRIDKDGLFDENPYIDATYTCSDAWDDYADYETGVKAILEEARQVAEKEGYDEILPVTLRSCSLENHRIYRIAHELGVELSNWDTEFPIPQEEKERADAIFKARGIDDDDFVVAIHRRGANIHKYWDVEEAARFVDYMVENYNAKFIAFETHTDLDREEARQLEGENIFSTYRLPDMNLKLSAAFIDKCNLFVGIDSGPMWMATTTKTPIISLFTMTWMHQSAPMSKDSYIVCSDRSKEMATEKFKAEHKDRIVYSSKDGTSIDTEAVISCLEKLEIEGLINLPDGHSGGNGSVHDSISKYSANSTVDAGGERVPPAPPAPPVVGLPPSSDTFREPQPTKVDVVEPSVGKPSLVGVGLPLVGEKNESPANFSLLEKAQKGEAIVLPDKYCRPGSYWAAFLTLYCTAKCTYCIQHLEFDSFQKAQKVKMLSGEQWVTILNSIKHDDGRPLAVIGGEASMHPDFLYILNNLEGYFVTVTTNVYSKVFEDIDRFAEELKPKSTIRFNTSFHPDYISIDDFCHRVKKLRENRLWVDQIAMVDHPESNFAEYQKEFQDRGVPLRPQTFLGNWKGVLYPNPNSNITNDLKETGISDYRRLEDGFSNRKRSSVLCATDRFLISPDGAVFNCHYRLYSRHDPVGSVLEGFDLPSDYFICHDYGFCNLCDFSRVNFKPLDPSAKIDPVIYVDGEGGCRLCGGKYLTVAYKDLLMCNDCGVLFKSDLPDKDELMESLSGFLLSACFDGSKGSRRFKEADYQLDLIEKYTKKGYLFDIGCASGFFIKRAFDRGWSTNGTLCGNDISKASVQWAKENFEIDIGHGYFEDIDLPLKHFNTVVLWHSLEHTLNPLKTLQKCNRILADGGIILISVPEKAVKDVAQHYEPMHLYEFNRDSLDNLLCRTGFDRLELIERTDTHIPQIDVVYRKVKSTEEVTIQHSDR